MWRQRNLTLEGKIIIFKTLTLSKFVFLAQPLPFPKEITSTIQRIQREFLFNSSNVKIKHETICNDFLAYNALGLKIYMTKTLMTGFQCILLIMHLGKTFFIQILVSKLCIASVSYFLRRHSSIMEKKLFSYLLPS